MQPVREELRAASVKVQNEKLAKQLREPEERLKAKAIKEHNKEFMEDFEKDIAARIAEKNSLEWTVLTQVYGVSWRNVPEENRNPHTSMSNWDRIGR